VNQTRHSVNESSLEITPKVTFKITYYDVEELKGFTYSLIKKNLILGEYNTVLSLHYETKYSERDDRREGKGGL